MGLSRAFMGEEQGNFVTFPREFQLFDNIRRVKIFIGSKYSWGKFSLPNRNFVKFSRRNLSP